MPQQPHEPVGPHPAVAEPTSAKPAPSPPKNVPGACWNEPAGAPADNTEALEPVSYGKAFRGFFPDGPPILNDTPLAAAWLWWHAVLAGNLVRAAELSANPADWGDYSAAAEDLAQHALVQHTEPSTDQPGRLAYARLIPNVDQPVQVLNPTDFTEGRWLTLVRPDGLWLVWGLSPAAYRPEAGRVFPGTN